MSCRVPSETRFRYSLSATEFLRTWPVAVTRRARTMHVATDERGIWQAYT